LVSSGRGHKPDTRCPGRPGTHSDGTQGWRKETHAMAKHSVKALPYANDALKGIGAKTVEIHHDKLYAGYVNKRNEIEDALAGAKRVKALSGTWVPVVDLA